METVRKLSQHTLKFAVKRELLSVLSEYIITTRIRALYWDVFLIADRKQRFNSALKEAKECKKRMELHYLAVL